MWDIAIIVVAVLLMAGLLVAERRESLVARLLTKTPLSCLFVLTAVLQPHPVERYAWFLVAGLVLSLVGDVCLALPQEKAFMAGLVSFLLGHVLYVVAFVLVTGIGIKTFVGAGVIVLVSGGVFVWLRPHLAEMKGPVLAYIVVITVMLSAAWSILVDTALPVAGRSMVFAGALLFYLSDVTVARDRFVKTEFANRLVGLPLYYAGQFLLAFSVARVG